MRKTKHGRTLSVILCAAMLFTSVPVNAENVGDADTAVIEVTEAAVDNETRQEQTQSGLEAETVSDNSSAEEGASEEGEEESFAADDDAMLYRLDWKAASDEEISNVVNSVSAETVGTWLRAMAEEDYVQLLGRETRLSEQTKVIGFDSETGEVTETKQYDTYADYALESMPKLRGTFSKTTLTFYVDTVQGGQTLTSTVTMTLTNTSTSKQDFNKIAISGKSHLGFNLNQWTSRRTSSYGGNADSYIYAHPKMSFTIPAGYSVKLTSSNCNTAKRGKTVYLANGYTPTESGITGTSFSSSNYVNTASPLELAACIDLLYNAGGNIGAANSRTSGGNIIYTLTLNPASYTVNYLSGSQSVGSSLWVYGQPHAMLAAPAVPNVKASFDEGGGIGNYARDFSCWRIGAATYSANQSIGDLTTVNGATVTATAEFAPATVMMAGTPSKTGYTFLGWRCDQDGVTRAAGEQVQAYSDVTFKAQWRAHQYTVILNGNGGSEVGSVTAVYDQNTPLPTPTRIGYSFIGWGGGLVKSAYNLTAVNQGVVELSAQWAANDTPYTVNRYIQKAVGSQEYELYTAPEGTENPVLGTEVKSAPTDTMITEHAKEIEGYITPSAIGPKAISGDGQTVFDFYYNIPSLTVNHYYRNTPNGEWILYDGTMGDYTEVGYTRTSAAKKGESTTPEQLNEKVLAAFEKAHSGYYLAPTEGPKTIVINKTAEVNYYYEMKKKDLLVSYEVEHHIQKTIGGKYEKYASYTCWAEGGSMVSVPLDDAAIAAVDAVEGGYCEKPQLQTIAITENMVIRYYYPCVSQKPNRLDDASVDEIAKRLAEGLSFKMDIGGVNYEIVQNADGTFGIKFTSTIDSRIVIPDTITIGNTVYRVTEIHDSAFKENTTVKEVVLGQNISKIGTSAFENCKSLEKVTLNAGLVTIGDKAFKGCSSLKSMKLPTTLQVIGAEAYMNCTSLKTVTLNEGLLKINGKAFYGCKSLTKLKIPKSVLKIHRYAFAKCTSLKTITFASQSKLLAMNEGVLYGCSSLKKIKLPPMLKDIAVKAFMDCKKLSSVTGGEGVTSIGKGAFENCYKLTKFTVQPKVQTISKKAFYNCKALKKVTIKSKALTRVGAKAFKKCKKNIVFSVPSGKAASYKALLKGTY